MAKRRCDQCRYWRNGPAEAGLGTAEIGACCVDPPTMVSGSYVGLWPRTYRDDWCGRWENEAREKL